MLWAMPGCMDHAQPHIAERQLLIVLERQMWILGARALKDGDGRAGLLGELMVTGDVVGMIVRLDNVLERQLLPVEKIENLIDHIDARIDDRGLSTGGRANEIGGTA